MNLLIKPINDLVFKAVFGNDNNKDILMSFLQSALEHIDIDIVDLTIKNPINTINNKDDKVTILDLKIETSSGDFINVELQTANHANFKDRIIIYHSKLLDDQVEKGGDYLLAKSISIIICNFNLFKESKTCSSAFMYADLDKKLVLSEKSLIMTFELRKDKSKLSKKLINWLSFISSETEEDFSLLENKDPSINKAIQTVKILSEDRDFIIELKQRKEIMDKYNFDVYAANLEGKKEGIEQGKKEGKEEGKKEISTEILNLIKNGVSIKEIEQMLKEQK